MSACAPPDHPDLRDRLPADAYWQLVRTLRLTLPRPPGDDPEDLLRRDHAAIARVAALAPANATEADIAAQFVAASEQWKDCLRLAQLPETAPEWASKCRAQAIGMMRQVNGALRLLLRLQDARRKLEGDAAACDRLAWTEHCALGLMAEALEHLAKSDDFAATPLSGHPEDPGDLPTTPQPPERRRPAADPARARVEQPAPDHLADAERYAILHPERAALIRRTGRLPHDVRYFSPPEATLVPALVAGNTPTLAALDSAFSEPRAA